jgi:hypothetical protein
MRLLARSGTGPYPLFGILSGNHEAGVPRDTRPVIGTRHYTPGGYTYDSSIFMIVPLGCTPTSVLTALPPANTVSIGMESTP